jgi:hypothetical protein
MTARKIQAVLALVMLLGIGGQSSDMQALGVSSLWPKVCAIGTSIRNWGSHLVNSRYIKPLVSSGYIKPLICLSAVIAAGYLGWHDKPARSRASSKNGAPVGRDLKAQPADRSVWDTFTDEGYLRREQLQLHADVPAVRGRAIQVNDAHNGVVRVQQAVVLDQFRPLSGGGSSSCGYHALKNAVGIASMLLGADKHNWLVNRNFVNQSFGFGSAKRALGMWRGFIIDRRKKQALRTWICDVLLPLRPMGLVQTPAQFNVEAVRGLYQTLRGNYADEVIRRFSGERDPIQLTPHAFMEWVQAREIPIADDEVGRYRAGCTKADIMAHIKDPQTIAAYFDLREFGIDRGTMFNLYRKLEEDGENLHTDEFEPLIRRAKEEVQVAGLDQVPIHVIEDINVIADPRLLGGAMRNEDVEAIRGAIQAGQRLPQQIYAFVIGDMQQPVAEPEQQDEDGDNPQISVGCLNGHWRTLVLDNTVPDQRRYTLADSAGNGVCLYGGACKRFIRYLEGDGVANQLQVPDTHRERWPLGWVVHKWRKLMWQEN